MYIYLVDGCVQKYDLWRLSKVTIISSLNPEASFLDHNNIAYNEKQYLTVWQVIDHMDPHSIGISNLKLYGTRYFDFGIGNKCFRNLRE